MISDIFKAWNKIINSTATAVIDSQLIDKYTSIVNTYLLSSVEAVRDLTKVEEPASE